MADEPKVDDDEAEPLSSRDVELEPVSLRDIEMILAPGKAPPLLSKPETLADKMKRLEAARAKEGGKAAPDAPTRPDTPALIKPDEKKKAPAPPPRKAEAKPSADLEKADLREALERAKAPLPPPQPKDSGLEDLRQLVASHPPPAKKSDAVDFDSVLRDGEAPPPPAPLPPDLTALQGGDVKAKAQPKAPLKKREAKKEPADDAPADAPLASERPPRSSPGSKRPSARSERPRTTGVPAKSIEPSRPSSSVRPSKAAPAEAPSGGGRTIMVAIGGIALLGVGYFLGRSNEQPAQPSGPAATVTVTVTVTASAPLPPETAAAVEPTAEPTASASAAPASNTSTALPTALTGAVATAAGTATSKPTATPGGEFDKAAANAALSGAMGQAAACKREGDPSGKAQVSVTFAPSGKATIANVNGPPFAGTATGGCIAKAFRSASVPPFSGDPMTVSKTVNIP